MAILWALAFAVPFDSRYLPREVPSWPILLAALAAVCLMQWGLTRATGIKMPFRNLRYLSPGRPAGIAILMVSLAADETEFLLIRHGLIAAAIVVAALAVVAEITLLRAAVRVTRRELRTGGGAV